MDWTHYSLKFRLLSPLHIGYRKVGNLMQTRQYVPGKNIWAALTARLTRDYHDGSLSSEYKTIGNDSVQKYFRFGYLWPSLNGKDPCFYWENNDFDYLFLDSYASTALDYSVKSALDGSLHETEFIAPVTRDRRSVYVLGDLWVNDVHVNADQWHTAMKHIKFGGELSYGWGRLNCQSDWEKGQNGSGKTVTGHSWKEESGMIILTLNKGDHTTAHTLACDEGSATGLVGQVEPLVGREWDEHPGQHTPFEQVYFSPGSRVDHETEFIIVNNGRWMK